MANATHTVNSASNPNEHTVAYGGAVALALTNLDGFKSAAVTIVGKSHATPTAPTVALGGSPTGVTASFTQVADPGDGEGRSWRVRYRVVGSDGSTAEQYSIVGTVNDAGLLPVPAGEQEGERHADLGWIASLNAALGGRSITFYNVKAPPYSATGNGTIDDTTAVQDAVTAAFNAGAELYWPPGDYLTTASITNFHSVRHRGPGRVKRDAVFFAVEPTYSQTNVIHIGPTGNDANDGIGSTAGSRILTLGRARDILRNYGAERQGDWLIFLFAGTYTPNDVLFDQPGIRELRIAGPSVGGHPNVPTVIFDGQSSAIKGIRAQGPGVKLRISDCKFIDYVGGNLGTGLFVDKHAELITTNVHASGCDWGGITIRGMCRFSLSGGILDSNRFGVVVADSSFGTVGASAITISNNTEAGVEWSRGAMGHVDNALIDTNAIGVKVYFSSRVHIDSCDIRDSTTAGATADSSSTISETSNDWHENDANANAVKWIMGPYSGIHNGFLDATGAGSEMRLVLDRTVYQHTGTTAKTTVATPWTIPAYWFEDDSKKIRIVIRGNVPAANTANNFIGVDLGATQIELSTFTGTPGASVSFVYEMELWADGSSSQYYNVTQMHAVGASPRIVNGTRTANTTIALPVNITVQLADAGETLRIERIELFLTG